MPDKLEERLRSSAAAFREHPVYDSEGDGCYLGVQADELSEAADEITRLKGEVEEWRDTAKNAHSRTLCALALIDELVFPLERAREIINSFYVSLGMRDHGRAENLSFIDAAISKARSSGNAGSDA